MLDNTLKSGLLALPFITVAILALPSSSLFRYGLYPLPLLLALRAVMWPPTDGPVEETYVLGLFGSSFFFRLLDYLYLQGYDTPQYFYRVNRKPGTSLERQDYPESTLARIKWALLLLISQRGIGWNFEVPLPETKYPTTRTIFIRQAIVTLLEIYLGLYLITQCCQYMVSTLRQELSPEPYPWVYDLFRNELFQMVAALTGWVISIISHISVLYAQISIVCVGFGIGGSWADMEMWPKTFGRIEDSWSVRNVWGKTWHQTLRRCLSAPGDLIADWVFGDASGLSRYLRLIRRYFLLFSAFTVSGILHAFGVYFVTVTEPQPYEDSTPISIRPPWYATAYFFVAQAAVIATEDFTFWIFGISSEYKDVKLWSPRWLVGMAYTLVWFVWSTTALWIHPQLAAYGYQRLIDNGNGYVHVLEAVGKATDVMPFNPWPFIFERSIPIIRRSL
ncbi:hypothetical protein ABW19_dt0205051 [Dactylella cylindrospora]|nr:hypothetical protein ABW19_dt0205051 [Dactylella cylindrospora]